MDLWLLIALLGLIKLPIVALMLWLPFRADQRAAAVLGEETSGEDEGGSKTPGAPHDPRPCTPSRRPPPRRGPHGTPAPTAPARVRSPLVRVGQRRSRSRYRLR